MESGVSLKIQTQITESAAYSSKAAMNQRLSESATTSLGTEAPSRRCTPRGGELEHRLAEGHAKWISNQEHNAHHDERRNIRSIASPKLSGIPISAPRAGTRGARRSMRRI